MVFHHDGATASSLALAVADAWCSGVCLGLIVADLGSDDPPSRRLRFLVGLCHRTLAGPDVRDGSQDGVPMVGGW